MGVLYWAARNLALVIVVLTIVALSSHILTEKWMYQYYGQLFVEHRAACRHLLAEQTTQCLERMAAQRWHQISAAAAGRPI